MAIHFDKSHYACRDLECKQRGFIVFKDKTELDNHKFKEHGIGTGKVIVRTSKNNENVKIKDKEGRNFEDQVISS